MMLQTEPTTFIACLDCRVLEPEVGPMSYAAAVPRDPSRGKKTPVRFLEAHSRHHTARLERRELDLSSDQHWWHRNSAESFAATDGQQLYVVTGTRPAGAEQEILYRFRPGTLQAKESTLAVDEDTIRRGLVSALFPYQLHASKFRLFMSALHSIIRELSSHHLELVFEAADDLSIGIARMPESAYAELASRSATLFDAWELPQIQQFLSRDRDHEGLLALRVRRELAALDA